MEKQRLLQPGVSRSLALYALGAIIGLGVAGYALFTASGTTSNIVPPEDIAMVNGRHILRSDFQTQTEIEMGVPFAQTTREQRDTVLAAMIDEELLVQRGLEVDLAASDPDVRAAMVAGITLQVTAETLAKKPTEPEVRAYYDAHRDRYGSEGTMQLRDLVMSPGPGDPGDARARAAEAARALRSSPSPDAAIATYGLADSGLIDRGDNFDFAVRAKLGDALYAAASALKPGEVSDPLERPDGLHLILLVKRVPSVSLAFEEVADKVWQDMNREARERVEKANLAYLKSRADIIVAPDDHK